MITDSHRIVARSCGLVIPTARKTPSSRCVRRSTARYVAGAEHGYEDGEREQGVEEHQAAMM
jgi:hypothetical protein